MAAPSQYDRLVHATNASPQLGKLLFDSLGDGHRPRSVAPSPAFGNAPGPAGPTSRVKSRSQPRGEHREISVEASVLDISGGGLSITIPSEGMVVEPDMEFGNCRLMLPETGAIVTSLRVRNLFRITNRDGSITLRAGCEFTHLSSAMASTIQRYILKVERERNARERIR